MMDNKPNLCVTCRESSRVICLQVLPSYMLAGLGMAMAGMLLDQVQVSDILQSDIYMIHPSIHQMDMVYVCIFNIYVHTHANLWCGFYNKYCYYSSSSSLMDIMIKNKKNPLLPLQIYYSLCIKCNSTLFKKVLLIY